MTEASRIDDLLDRADELPFGPEERALLDEAVALAAESGDEVREYRARMRLTNSANMTGDTDALLSSFAWCVGKHDEDPARFPISPDDGTGADLLWQYKWMAGTLSASPLFPAEQIRAVLEDMQARYERAGVGLSGVWMARFNTAHANGWLDEAAEAYRVLAATERDEYSHCDACVRSASAEYLAEIGRTDEAIAMVEELVEGGFTCGEEPERALSDALLPYLRAGRLDEARAFHLRSYRDARGNADNLGIIANHLEFCAITRNEARGLALLERHLGWLAHDPLNQRGHVSALAAAGLLLDQVVRAGHGDTLVRGADASELVAFLGEHDGPWTAAELAPVVWAAAERIGAAFDARNGNRYIAERIEATRRLAEEHYDVPLAAEGFAPRPVSEAPVEPTTAEGWVAAARERIDLGDHDGALAAVARGLALIEEGDTRTALDLGSLRLVALVAGGAVEEAAAALPERIEALRAAGRSLQADVEETLGLQLHGIATADDLPALDAARARVLAAATSGAAGPDAARTAVDLAHTTAMVHVKDRELADATAAAEAAVAMLDGIDDDDLAEATRYVAAMLRAEGEEPATAGPLLDAILDAPSPNRVRQADALRLRARLLAGSGEFESAHADAERAIELELALGERDRVIGACQLSAAILDDLGRHDDAIARLRLAVHHAELAESLQLLGLRYGVARQLGRAGRADEAIEILQSVYEQEEAAGAHPAARGETLHLLGNAFRATGEAGSAAGAWYTAADLFEEGEAWPGAVAVLVDLGRLHLELEYVDEAVELFERAVADARRAPEAVGSLADALHLLGRAQGEAGREDSLATLDEVAALAEEHDADWLAADITDSRARALASLGRLDEAVAAALVAAERFEQAGAAGPAGGSMLFAGRVLQSASRHDEAAVLLGQATERFTGETGAEGALAVARMTLADSLDILGRPSEAAEQRSLAEQG
ncbi:hypothetical protein ABIQ69_01525 [Agromyces sp. G08B096]|uniref:Tetratricopeptide repeat protein n=1 Tax=Agromyces sp. G08B096 TaxID=3156399 RepID=A0AAU7W7M3_9MICO